VTRACVVCGVALPQANPRRITCSDRCRSRRSFARAVLCRAEALDGSREAVAGGNVRAVEVLAAWTACPAVVVDVTGPKRCSRCEAVKPRDDFYRDPRTPDGLRAACRECVCSGVRRAQRKRRETLAA
jgi:hypothetical protein